MREYDKMAREFLENVGAELKIEYIGDVEGFPNSDDKLMHREYKCELSREGHIYEFPFYGSYMDWKNEKDPSEYDVLSCLEPWDPGSIDDFVEMYGYEVHKWADVRRIEKIYEEVLKQYRALAGMFSDDELEMLGEIQ